MIAALAPLTLALAIAQAPAPEVHALNHVPDDADIVVRVSNLTAANDDLKAMLKAMSPANGPQAIPFLDQSLAQFGEAYGKEATQNPFLVAIRAVQAEGTQQPPFAVIVPSSNPQQVLDIVRGESALVAKDGLDTFTGRQGETIYVTTGSDFAAFGPDKTLVQAASELEGEVGGKVAKTLAGDLGRSFAQGDLGVYVNIAALASRYEAQIDNAREQFMSAIDMVGQQAATGSMMSSIKEMYGKLFDSVGDLDALAFSIDTAAAGLVLDAAITAKPDTKTAAALAELQATSLDPLAKLPAGYNVYTLMNLDGELLHRLKDFSTSMMPTEVKGSPEFEKAAQALAAQGTMLAYGGVSLWDEEGMKSLTVTETKDPAALAKAGRDMTQALADAGTEDGALAFFKSIKITPGAETYKGISFDKSEMTIDVEKLGGPESPAAKSILTMYRGDTLTTFNGVHGSVLLSVIARDFETAKPLIDAYLAPSKTLGSSASFQAIRQQLPDKVTLIGLTTAQGIVKQVATQLGSFMGNSAIKVPANLPKEPVFLGGAANPVPSGVHARLVIPSNVGPVIESGVLPIIQGLQGRIDN